MEDPDGIDEGYEPTEADFLREPGEPSRARVDPELPPTAAAEAGDRRSVGLGVAAWLLALPPLGSFLTLRCESGYVEWLSVIMVMIGFWCPVGGIIAAVGLYRAVQGLRKNRSGPAARGGMVLNVVAILTHVGLMVLAAIIYWGRGIAIDS